MKFLACCLVYTALMLTTYFCSNPGLNLLTHDDHDNVMEMASWLAAIGDDRPL